MKSLEEDANASAYSLRSKTKLAELCAWSGTASLRLL
jgi:hypothetical protein